MCDVLLSALIAGVLYTGCGVPEAEAQNTTCANRPVGDISNACANTRFVDTAVTGGVASALNWYIVGSAQYPTLPLAVAAAKAAGNGNTVFIPGCGTYALGAGAVGLDATSASALTIRGNSNINAGAGQCVTVTYTGTGTMIDGTLSNGLDISGIYLLASGAGAKMFNLKDSFAPSVYNNVILNNTSNANNIGFDLDTAQDAYIHRNIIGISGGIGIRGVAPAGSFSVKTTVEGNTFTTLNRAAISAPGQVWTVKGNISQNPAEKFIEAGPATTCDILNVEGNDIDDIVGGAGKTIITDNCNVLNLRGNRFGYTSGTVTNVSKTNSTGTVNSTGDRLSGTVGIAIGTGNNLSIVAPDAFYAPTTLYTGTPANTNVIWTLGGKADITQQLRLGVAAGSGSLGVYNDSGIITLTPPAGAGNISVTWPGNSGQLQVPSNTATLTNKTMSGASNTFSNLALASLASQATNTIVGNATSGSASPTALAIGSCSTASSALTWTTNTGFGCNTAITASSIPVGGITGLGTDVATWLATPSSANLAAAVTGETGTGALVFGTAPTVTNPAVSGTLVITNTQNAVSAVTLFNTDAGTGANPEYVANNGTSNFKVGIRGTGQTAYGALTAGVGFNYSTTDLVIMADSGGKIVFAPGSSSEKARFSASGGLSLGTTVDAGLGSLHLAGHLATKAPVTLTGTSGTVATTDSSVIFNPSGAFTVTLPTCNATQSGHWLDVKSIAAQTIASASSNIVPRAGGAAGTALLASGAGNWARLQCDATNWIIMSGS